MEIVQFSFSHVLISYPVLFHIQSATKFEPSAQQLAEKERLLTTLQEEASIAKDKVKQLSQVLQQKNVLPKVYTGVCSLLVCV